MNSLKYSLMLSVLVTFGCGKDQFKVLESPIKATKIDDTTLDRKTTPPNTGNLPGEIKPGLDTDKNKPNKPEEKGNTGTTATGSGNDKDKEKDKAKNDDKNKSGGTTSSAAPMPTNLPELPPPPAPPVASGKVKEENKSNSKSEKKETKTSSPTAARESGASSAEPSDTASGENNPPPLNLNPSEPQKGQATEQKKEDGAEAKKDEASPKQEQNLALAEFKVDGKSYPVNLKSITLVAGTQADVKVEMKFGQDDISFTTEHRENDLYKTNAVKLDGDTELYVMAYCSDATCAQYAAGIVFWERTGKTSKIFRKLGITRINGKNQIFVDKAEPNSTSMADWLKFIVEKSK